PRAKASGFTRISVLSKGAPFRVLDQAPGGAAAASPSPRGRRVGGGCSTRVDEADERLPRRRDGSETTAVMSGVPAISDSQYGQIFHSGSSGLPQVWHGSLSRRRQLGQRRKVFSTRKPQ